MSVSDVERVATAFRIHEAMRRGHLLSLDLADVTVLVGLPASGKTTVANQLCILNNVLPISKDTIRSVIYDYDEGIRYDMEGQVEDLYLKSIRACLCAGRKLVLDATHLSRATRRKCIDIARESGRSIEAWLIAPKICTCIIRNRDRTVKRVPGYDYLVMLQDFQFPTVDEGFDRIAILHGRDYEDYNTIDIDHWAGVLNALEASSEELVTYTETERGML